MIFIDFETSSECDLKARGVYNYARDPSTQVLCLAWAIDDEDVQVWEPGQEFPKAVADAVAKGDTIYAHNAAFERLVWSYVLGPDHGVPVPKLEQFYCTATQARANCAPGGLEDVGRFAGASMRKDHRGAQLVRKCCIPPFKHTPQDLADLFEYCAQDVRAMRAFSQAMRQLTEEELADYHVNERINDRGVLVDVPLALAAQRYAAVELEEIQHRVVEVTGGAVTSVRSPRMREWVLARLGPEARKLAVVHKDGEAKDSIDKSVRANLLALAEEDPDEVPPDVAEVIQAADDLWASSAAKFGRMANLADDEDQRVRGAFVFAGGSATGRASSYGLQAHNFPRVSAKDPQAVRDAMLGGYPVAPAFGKRVTDVLKAMLRPSLMARPGHSLVVADWSAIEGRVHPWLANCPAGEAKLDVFRSKLDPYKVNAAATFGIQYEDVTEDQRQVGKVQELALGFLGGPGAFETFGRVYGVKLTDAEVAKAVSGWRKANPWAVAHGQALEGAYMRAMRNEGHEFSAGRVTYLFDGKHLWYALPSGRVLCYPFARLEEDGVSYAKASWKPAADAKEWPRGRLWRGLACIAKDTPVLTERGWIPIQQVQAADSVWDGVEWVRHDGVAHQGLGRVNYAFGVAMTADHLVLTDAGWKRADEAERHHRAACRLPLRYRVDRLGWAARRLANHLRLRPDTRDEVAELHEVGAGGPAGVLRLQAGGAAIGCDANARHEQTPSVRRVAQHDRPLPAADASGVEELRRAGHSRVARMARVVRELLGRHGADVPARVVSGQDQQRRPVCAGQLPVGYLSAAGPQHAQLSVGGQPAGAHAGVRAVRAHGGRTDDAAVPAEPWRDGRGSDRAAERCAEVFDLINCGPRHRFVVQGLDGQPLIVHNCENVTQATAADILRHALRRLDGYGVVLHVHDEIVVETPEPDRIQTLMTDVMTTAPAWAQDLPLAIKSEIMTRYAK